MARRNTYTTNPILREMEEHSRHTWREIQRRESQDNLNALYFDAKAAKAENRLPDFLQSLTESRIWDLAGEMARRLIAHGKEGDLYKIVDSLRAIREATPESLLIAELKKIQLNGYTEIQIQEYTERVEVAVHYVNSRTWTVERGVAFCTKALTR